MAAPRVAVAAPLLLLLSFLLLSTAWCREDGGGDAVTVPNAHSSKQNAKLLEPEFGPTHFAGGLAKALVPTLVASLDADPTDMGDYDALLDLLDEAVDALAKLDDSVTNALLSATTDGETDLVLAALRRRGKVGGDVWDKGVEALRRARQSIGRAVAEGSSATDKVTRAIEHRLSSLVPASSVQQKRVSTLSRVLLLTDVAERCRKEVYQHLCDGVRCKNGGSCVKTPEGFKCLCPPGFAGNYCQTNVDECESEPCGEHGRCTDLVDGFHCTCKRGFEGDRCQLNVDDCALRPCLNGATCVDGLNSYTCRCAEGFSGDQCEVRDNHCADRPCKNGGACHSNTHGHTCECRVGFSGENCETDDDDCALAPCRNGGTCTDKVGGFLCACTDAWMGSRCQEMVDFCQDTPCKNHGVCVSKEGGFDCVCPDGFRGDLCEEVVSECQTKHPCRNGGRCVDGIGSYVCQCAPGFRGRLCELTVDECDGLPCQNGGSCHDGSGSFQCDCMPGFSGELCERNFDECLDEPCEHGRCVDGVNSYECVCEDGWTGTKCEEEVNMCESRPPPCVHGECEPRLDGFECGCKEGFFGARCESEHKRCDGFCRNGGACHIGKEGPECTCTGGYEGTNCETLIDHCAGAPCKNGASCISQRAGGPDGSGGHVCVCAAGWTGSACTESVNECAANPCMHGGVCTDKHLGYECVCPSGLTGKRCETDIDDCADSPCQHGAVCLDGLASFTCLCPHGYTGKLCDESVDVCVAESVTCQNGGTCVSPRAEEFECRCLPGFSGTYCQIDDDECEGEPCLNGGTCVDGVNSYSCECPRGFAGARCGTNIDDCADSPCQNGGTCSDQVHGYDCACPEGYHGDRCERSDFLPLQEGDGWVRALQICADRGLSLCSAAELCPRGPNRAPARQIYGKGSQFVASADFVNSFVDIGALSAEDRQILEEGGELNTGVCSNFRARFGHAPSWGLEGKSNTLRAEGVLCCPRGCQDQSQLNSGKYAVTYTFNGHTCADWERTLAPGGKPGGDMGTEQLSGFGRDALSESRRHELSLYGPVCRRIPGSQHWGCPVISEPAEEGGVGALHIERCAMKCAPLDVCAGPTSPCLNGGECSAVAKNVGGYRCECPRVWTGRQCQKSIYAVDLKESNPSWKLFRAFRHDPAALYVKGGGVLPNQHPRVSRAGFLRYNKRLTDTYSVVFDLRVGGDLEQCAVFGVSQDGSMTPFTDGSGAQLVIGWKGVFTAPSLGGSVLTAADSEFNHDEAFNRFMLFRIDRYLTFVDMYRGTHRLYRGQVASKNTMLGGYVGLYRSCADVELRALYIILPFDGATKHPLLPLLERRHAEYGLD